MEKGVVDWIVLYLVSQGATLRVQSVCILRKVGDSAAQQRLFSASLPSSLCASTSPVSLSHSLPLSLSLAAALSALLHSTPRGPALCLPCQLNGVCQVCQYDWFLWFCQLSCVKTWQFNLTREKEKRRLIVCVSLMFCHCNWLILPCSLQQPRRAHFAWFERRKS